MNVYDLSRKQFRDLTLLNRENNIVKMTAFCRGNDLPFVYNHPFWFESGDTPQVSAIPQVCELFPVVEYNMHRVRGKNMFAWQMARQAGKGIIATTDTHIGEIGKAMTAAPGETFREYFSNIAAGNSRLIRQDWTMNNFLTEIDIWIDTLRDMAREDLAEQKFAGIPKIYRVRKLFTHPGLNWFPLFVKNTRQASLRPFINIYFWFQNRESRRIREELKMPRTT